MVERAWIVGQGNSSFVGLVRRRCGRYWFGQISISHKQERTDEKERDRYQQLAVPATSLAISVGKVRVCDFVLMFWTRRVGLHSRWEVRLMKAMAQISSEGQLWMFDEAEATHGAIVGVCVCVAGVVDKEVEEVAVIMMSVIAGLLIRSICRVSESKEHHRSTR